MAYICTRPRRRWFDDVIHSQYPINPFTAVTTDKNNLAAKGLNTRLYVHFDGLGAQPLDVHYETRRVDLGSVERHVLCALERTHKYSQKYDVHRT